MILDEVKFGYSLMGSGWAKVIFEIADIKLEYDASYTNDTLGQIFDLAVEALDFPAKEGFNDRHFIIDEEWQTIEVHLLFEIGQNRMANMQIKEICPDKNGEEKIAYTGLIDYHQFVQQVIISATNILRKFGLTGYSIQWQIDFPITSYLRTLDFFEDYHNLNYLTMYEYQITSGFMKTDVFYEMKLLGKYLGGIPKKDIYYYLYKGNLLELEEYISNNTNEIDKLDGYRYNYTPLICAIKAGMESTAFILVRYGADIMLTDTYQHTVLHFAVQAHSYSVCQKLVELDKNLVNAPNKWGRSPIFYSVPDIKNQGKDSNDYRIFDLLLQNGSNLFQVSDAKATVLDMIEANDKHYNNGLLEYIKLNYPHLLVPNKGP